MHQDTYFCALESFFCSSLYQSRCRDVTEQRGDHLTCATTMEYVNWSSQGSLWSGHWSEPVKVQQLTNVILLEISLIVSQ